MNSTNMWTRLIRKYFILILLGIFSLVLILKNLSNNKKVEQKGVYVIERLISKEQYRSGAPIYKYEFFFRNKKYISNAAGIGSGKIGDLYFIKILPQNPEVGEVIDSVSVPPCITMQDVPFEGWKEIPKDTCK